MKKGLKSLTKAGFYHRQNSRISTSLSNTEKSHMVYILEETQIQGAVVSCVLPTVVADFSTLTAAFKVTPNNDKIVFTLYIFNGYWVHWTAANQS